MKNENKPSGFKKEIKSKSVDRADYSKANKRREEQEDIHKFEDFNSFVKETGWKKTNSKSGKVIGKSTGAKIGAKYGTKTGVKSGVKSEARTGAKNGEKADTRTNARTDSRTGTRTGVKTDARMGMRTDARTDARADKRTDARIDDRTDNRTNTRSTRTGTKTGGYESSRPSVRPGTKVNNFKGDHADYRGGKKTFGSEGDKAEQLKTSSTPRREGSYNKEARTQDARGSKRTTEYQGRENKDNQNQGRYEQDRPKQGRYDQNNQKQGRFEQDRPKQGRYEQDRQETTVTTRGACTYQRECGSCNIQNVSYSKHLSDKQKEVDTLLKKYCKVDPIIGMKQPDHYRYKVHAVFDHDRKGNPISGVYEEGTHRVISVDKCLIHNEKADEIIASIRGMLKSFKILTYDEDTGYGLIRHVLIRSGYRSGEIMVVLVLASPIMPSKNNFVKALRAQHPEITTIVVNVNDKRTSMVLGDKEQVLYGKGYIEDSLCGKTFRISAKSFYQVNPVQTEILYQKAIELAELSGTETVIDAYCGIGTIGLIASDKANKVIGVELNKDAVRDAVVNAKRNEADNIEFYNNDAGVFMSQMAEKGESADVVFMDPPRTGSTPQFMDAVAVLKPSRVVYVSCNPVTLARDLEYITKKGYKVQRAIPVDMFPWTGHVETLVLMSK